MVKFNYFEEFDYPPGDALTIYTRRKKKLYSVYSAGDEK